MFGICIRVAKPDLVIIVKCTLHSLPRYDCVCIIFLTICRMKVLKRILAPAPPTQGQHLAKHAHCSHTTVAILLQFGTQATPYPSNTCRKHWVHKQYTHAFHITMPAIPPEFKSEDALFKHSQRQPLTPYAEVGKYADGEMRNVEERETCA